MPFIVRTRHVLLVMLLPALAVWAAWATWRHYAGPVTRVETSVIAPEVPVVIRTEGGLLEVAVVRAQERFTRADTREFWGIPLGTTVSHVQAPVHYRYHIELAREWQVTVRGKTCIVQAPAIQPSLPVAFDTAAMQKYTSSGWARFNKDENLATLEQSMTPELEKRARSEAYRQLVTAPARKTVSEFVSKWLAKEMPNGKAWGTGPDYKVEVYFPGEPLTKSPEPQQD
ncbi:MAG: hypothetical protein EOO28_35200 [Comamonadaceae bacterium]|nr:MAG: hypothetical protein EOO28_35200 [Comamonadaceae bacterium]